MTDTPSLDISVLEARIRRNVGRMMFATRWVMAPIYLGLLVVLALVAVKFAQKLILAIPGFMALDTSDTILIALTLVDLSLVANLVVIVIFAGWENFVGPLLRGVQGADAGWLGKLDFAAVKQKLFASIAAIAAIQMLETFVHIADIAKQDAAWQLAILLGIGVTGVLLAAMDRLSGDK
jgi:uncharacterized protein (TIGR00645 family)